MGARHILIKKHWSKMTAVVNRNEIEGNRDTFWRIYRLDKEHKNAYQIEKKYLSISIKDHKLRLETIYVTKFSREGNWYFSKTVTAHSFILNLKKGEWFYNNRTFGRRGRLKKGKWNSTMQRNPFRSPHFASGGIPINQLAEFNLPEYRKIISYYLGEYTDTYKAIIDWFCNINGIIKPDCHYEMMALYPGKKWITKYPKLAEAILRSTKNYTRTLNGLLQTTNTYIKETLDIGDVKFRNYRTLVPNKILGRTPDTNSDRNYWSYYGRFNSRLETYFRKKDEELDKATKISVRTSKKILQYDITSVIMLIKILGHEAFASLNPEIYTKREFADTYNNMYDYMQEGLETFIGLFQMMKETKKDINLDKEDAFKIVNLYNLVRNGKTTKEKGYPRYKFAEDVSYQDLGDHLSQMMKYEKLTGEKWKLRAETLKSFRNEHTILSRTIRLLDKEEFNLSFSDKMIEMVEKPIKGWTPYILKSVDDYANEGEHQNNCVYGYATNYGYSFIISLRKDKMRTTCEYHYNGTMSQARGKYNRDPEDKNVVQLLTKRLDQNSRLLKQPKKIYPTDNRVSIIAEAKQELALQA